MRIPRDQLEKKADRHLLDALEQADEQDELRMIVQVAGEDDPEAAARELDRKAFPSFKHYRQALVQKRRDLVQQQTTPVIDALKALELEVKGGELSTAVVVAGRAEQIARSLEHEGIAQAVLDREIGVEEE